jgi:TIR domain
MPDWHVFISHASEDKEAVAIPLAEALRRAGLRVWIDRQELRLGDSLREKIDEGLANSYFGVVILSPSFLAKNWPRRELDGMFAIEDAAGRKVILPVWYQLDKSTLAKHSPMLADRFAVQVSAGIAAVAKSIIDVVTAPESGVPADVAPTVTRLFLTLLDRRSDREAILGFLNAHPFVIDRALGFAPRTRYWSTALGSVTVDYGAPRLQFSTAELTWHFVQFHSPADAFFEGAVLAPAIIARVTELRNVRRWIASNLREARAALPDVDADFEGIVVAGRREQLSPAEQAALRDFNQEGPRIKVRTYDWLVDAAVTLG